MGSNLKADAAPTPERQPKRRSIRGPLLHFLDDPAHNADALQYFEDGLLLLEDGRVSALGPANELLSRLDPSWERNEYPNALILPGFIDTHVHYTQTDMIAAPGGTLLDWLEGYAFPAEEAFSDPDHAERVATFCLDEMLRNGTTTALVLASVHAHSVDAFFRAAQARRLRMIAGKVLMDRNAPRQLTEDTDRGQAETEALIQRWSGVERLDYAITPRFAPTSTERQLRLAGELAARYPRTYIHSHLAENQREIAWVAELFSGNRSYLDVYDHYGLLRERSLYAHCLHLDGQDRKRMAETGAAMAFCPSSNLFLGSGLFDLEAADATKVRVGLGTDVGAGTSFSLLRTMADAYKVLKLKGQTLSAARAFYLATLGGARALRLDHRIGNFLPGKEADFVVLNPQATPLMERRWSLATNLDERLFLLMMLGDEHAVQATYCLGDCLYSGEPLRSRHT